jgi:hypothetical protein
MSRTLAATDAGALLTLPQPRRPQRCNLKGSIVTVVLRHNHALELGLVEYRNSVTLTELEALADFQAAHPESMRSDSLNYVLPGTDFRSVELASLDALHARYSALFRPLNLQIYRRGAWICASDAARVHVQHWLGGRDMRKAMSSEVRLFETFAEAGDWLILTPSESAALERGEGFAEVVRFEMPVAAAFAR